jgi:biopolymer transport protein TolR
MAGLSSGVSGGRRRLLPTADINVTSLVDIAFVLLIIFMITAPLMQGGIELELPRTAARPLTPRESIVVSVSRDGTIYVDQTRVTYDEFRASFRAIVSRRGTSNVIFRGDRRAPYGSVVRVFAAIRQVGGDNLKVSIVTEEEDLPR